MKTVTLERFKKSRQTTVSASGFDFVIARPTPFDIETARANNGFDIHFLCRFVVGWSGVKESDLLPGGDPEPVDFNGELFEEWVKERPELWDPLINGVIDTYNAHFRDREERGNA